MYLPFVLGGGDLLGFFNPCKPTTLPTSAESFLSCLSWIWQKSIYNCCFVVFPNVPAEIWISYFYNVCVFVRVAFCFLTFRVYFGNLQYMN